MFYVSLRLVLPGTVVCGHVDLFGILWSARLFSALAPPSIVIVCQRCDKRTTGEERGFLCVVIKLGSIYSATTSTSYKQQTTNNKQIYTECTGVINFIHLLFLLSLTYICYMFFILFSILKSTKSETDQSIRYSYSVTHFTTILMNNDVLFLLSLIKISPKL